MFYELILNEKNRALLEAAREAANELFAQEEHYSLEMQELNDDYNLMLGLKTILDSFGGKNKIQLNIHDYNYFHIHYTSYDIRLADFTKAFSKRTNKAKIDSTNYYKDALVYSYDLSKQSVLDNKNQDNLDPQNNLALEINNLSLKSY